MRAGDVELTASLLRLLPPCVIDRDAPHGPSCVRKKMLTARELDPLALRDVEICLVQQGSRAESELVRATAQLPLRDGMQFAVEGGEERIGCHAVARIGRADEVADGRFQYEVSGVTWVKPREVFAAPTYGTPNRASTRARVAGLPFSASPVATAAGKRQSVHRARRRSGPSAGGSGWRVRESSRRLRPSRTITHAASLPFLQLTTLKISRLPWSTRSW